MAKRSGYAHRAVIRNTNQRSNDYAELAWRSRVPSIGRGLHGWALRYDS